MRGLDACRNVADLRARAARRLPAPLMDFLDGGGEDERSIARNQSAFDEHELLPRVLAGVANVDLSTEVLGQRIAMPLFTAPTGGSRIFHAGGEAAVARAAAAAGTFYALAAFGTTTVEQVAAASAGPKLLQLYPLRDPGLNRALVERARAAGYAALCLTVDCPVGGNRERDRRHGLDRRPRRLSPQATLSVLRRPRWLLDYLLHPDIFVPANFIPPGADRAARRAVMDSPAIQLDPAATWTQAAELIALWRGPFAVKGVLRADDALRAEQAGASAVIVSNHGGRQLDGSVPPIAALPDVVAAVGDRLEVILDGGVRRGTHVLRALALGARACTIGRPYLYGLAAGGEAGVARLFDLLRSEIQRDLILLGCPSVRAFGPDFIRRRNG